MLILRRKVGEAFLIGDHVSITILGTESNGTVSIGIDAPRDILILRSELQQAASANQDAAQSPPSPQMVQALGSVLSHSAEPAPDSDPPKP